jgi:hypothetical protein
MSSSSVKLKTINRRTREPKRASRQRSRREQRPKRFARTLFAHSRKGKRLLVPRSKLRPLPNSSSQLLQLASLYSRDQAKRSNKLDRSKQTLKPLLPNHSHIPSLFPSSKKAVCRCFHHCHLQQKKTNSFLRPSPSSMTNSFLGFFFCQTSSNTNKDCQHKPTNQCQQRNQPNQTKPTNTNYPTTSRTMFIKRDKQHSNPSQTQRR